MRLIDQAVLFRDIWRSLGLLKLIVVIIGLIWDPLASLSENLLLVEMGRHVLHWKHRWLGAHLEFWQIILILLRRVATKGVEVCVWKILIIEARKSTLFLTGNRGAAVGLPALCFITQLLADSGLIFWSLKAAFALWNGLFALSVCTIYAGVFDLVDEWERRVERIFWWLRCLCDGRFRGQFEVVRKLDVLETWLRRVWVDLGGEGSDHGRVEASLLSYHLYAILARYHWFVLPKVVTILDLSEIWHWARGHERYWLVGLAPAGDTHLRASLRTFKGKLRRLLLLLVLRKSLLNHSAVLEHGGLRVVLCIEGTRSERFAVEHIWAHHLCVLVDVLRLRCSVKGCRALKHGLHEEGSTRWLRSEVCALDVHDCRRNSLVLHLADNLLSRRSVSCWELHWLKSGSGIGYALGMQDVFVLIWKCFSRIFRAKIRN